jgi:hypothetical protein
VQTKEAFTPKIGRGTFWIPLSVPMFAVNTRSTMLSIIPEENRMQGARWDVGGDFLESLVISCMRLVRVKIGPKKICTHLFYRRSNNLAYDPERYQWNCSTPLMSYMAELGRQILKE